MLFSERLYISEFQTRGGLSFIIFDLLEEPHDLPLNDLLVDESVEMAVGREALAREVCLDEREGELVGTEVLEELERSEALEVFEVLVL